MGVYIESRGWPRGRRFSKEVHFPFSSKNFRMTFFRKVHSSAKFSDDLFQFFGFLALVFHFLHNSGPLSQNWPGAAYLLTPSLLGLLILLVGNTNSIYLVSHHALD